MAQLPYSRSVSDGVASKRRFKKGSFSGVIFRQGRLPSVRRHDGAALIDLNTMRSVAGLDDAALRDIAAQADSLISVGSSYPKSPLSS